MVERAGFWRRSLATLVDMVLVQALVQGLVALTFTASGGHVTTLVSLYSACQPAYAVPAGVALPADFVVTSQSRCTSSVFGAPTRTFYVARHEEKTGGVVSTTSYSAEVAPDGSAGIRSLNLDTLFYPLFILFRWASDRYAGGSPGRRLVRIAVTDVGGTASGAELSPLLARRYARFAWPHAPGTVMLALASAFGFLSGMVPPLVSALAWFAGSVLIGVVHLAAAQAIFRHSDTFYDEPAGTVVSTRLEIARARDMRPDARVAAGPGPVRDLGLAVAAARRSLPWASLGLAAAMAAAYLGEILLPVTLASPFGISIDTLMAWGGMDRELVLLVGQPYRLLTAIFLHVNATHLVLNGLVLLTAGVLLERVIGRMMFGAVFLLGGLAGSAASIAFNPIQQVAVGASGAVLGLLAAALPLSFRLSAGNARRWRQAWPVTVCIPALLPAVPLPVGFVVDRADHMGGEAAGLLLGLAIAMAWRTGAVRRPMRLLTLGVGAGSSVLLGVTVLAGGLRAPIQTAHLVPPAEIPPNDDEWRRRAPALAIRYPDDPRVLLSLATGQARDRREAQAVATLDESIAMQRRLAPASSSDFRFTAHNLLGSAFFDTGDLDAAIVQYSDALAERSPAELLRQRGISELYRGRTAEAVEDFKKALNLNPKENYSVLWLSIAASRGGSPDPIATTARSANLDTWPGQVVKFFADGLRADLVLATAGALDVLSDQHRLCEAKFYWAEWHIMRHETGDARPLLREAAATCPSSFIEHRAALEELAGHGGLPPE